MLSRRDFGKCALFGAIPLGNAGEFSIEEHALSSRIPSRMTLLIPNHLGPAERVPLVVLLHGLGETGDMRAGAYAWVERYGLGSAYTRLRNPPIARMGKRDDWGDSFQLLNERLRHRPFEGLVLACPSMPDLSIGEPHAFERLADLVDDAIALATLRAPVLFDHVLFGGCSLGGHFSLEVFLRRPERFRGWAGVQTAIGEASAPRYAKRIREALTAAGPKALLLQTSTGDPFRRASERLSQALSGVPHALTILPGPHDQPWLRESGTPTLLQWLSEARRFRA